MSELRKFADLVEAASGDPIEVPADLARAVATSIRTRLDVVRKASSSRKQPLDMSPKAVANRRNVRACRARKAKELS